MNLSREQTIIEHRKMWNWIAEETLKRKVKVTKNDYFLEHPECKAPFFANCYCCDYAMEQFRQYKSYYYKDKKDKVSFCDFCPIKWGSKTKDKCIKYTSDIIGVFAKGIFAKYEYTNKYKSAARLAKIIAELPEKEE